MTTSLRSVSWLAGAAVLSACCVHEPVLVPTTHALLFPGEKNTAYTQVAGVRVAANGDAWRGDPSDLEQIITPVRVAIVNHSGQPIRIAYKSFTLVSASGFRYMALPPFSLSGIYGERTATVASAAVTNVAIGRHVVWHPRFHHHRFYVASRYQRFYPSTVGLVVWNGPFGYDPYYYDMYYPLWEPVYLPTRDMLRWALPEGVVESGGEVSGFLYFQSVADAGTVDFVATLVNAETNVTVGTARIPFRIVKR